jgi:hypothetical protein
LDFLGSFCDFPARNGVFLAFLEVNWGFWPFFDPFLSISGPKSTFLTFFERFLEHFQEHGEFLTIF